MFISCVCVCVCMFFYVYAFYLQIALIYLEILKMEFISRSEQYYYPLELIFHVGEEKKNNLKSQNKKLLITNLFCFFITAPEIIV